MQREVLKGHLDLLLLSVVSRRPLHGYGIVEDLRTASAGVFDLAEGTVYPALYRLERTGLLTSRWADGGGRPRRVYALTSKGRKAMAEKGRSWTVFSKGMAAVVGE